MKSNSQKYILKNNLSHSLDTKLYLVNKISSALKIKYKNLLIKSNYKDKELKSDLSNLITTEYYSWKPKDVFSPIEKSFIEILKKKLPNLITKNKVKKKITSLIPLIDKYKKADIEEKQKLEKYIETIKQNKKEKEKDKCKIFLNKSKNHSVKNLLLKNNLEKQIKLNPINNIPIPIIKSLPNNNYELNNNKEIINNKEKEDNYLSTNISNINLNNSINTEDKIDFDNDLIEELGKPYHELLDKYKLKLENGLIDNKLLLEENKKYEEEQKEIKRKKLEESIELQNYLNWQIMEKNNRKKEEEEKDYKYLIYLKEDYEKWIKDEEEKKNIEKEKKIKFHKILLELIEEKNNINNSLNKNNTEENNYNENEEKNKEENLKRSKQKEYLKEIEKVKSENNIIQIQKREKEKEQEKKRLKEIEQLNNKKDEYSNSIQNKIKKRILEQEKVKTLLLNIYKTKQKFFDDNKYIKELEEQNKKNEIEKEREEKLRLKQIDEVYQSNLFEISLKNKKKLKQKEEDENYRLQLCKSYDNYIKKEKEEKIKEIEKYKKYRKELEEQIKENKRRNLKRIKLPSMI